MLLHEFYFFLILLKLVICIEMRHFVKKRLLGSVSGGRMSDPVVRCYRTTPQLESKVKLGCFYMY